MEMTNPTWNLRERTLRDAFSAPFLLRASLLVPVTVTSLSSLLTLQPSSKMSAALRTQGPSTIRRLASTTTSKKLKPPPTEPNTHFRITLRRSAISLPANIKATLEALGIHRRLQTVYHRHNPETAGKILRVKELVEVQNVPASAVRTKLEQRKERQAPRGYQVVGSSLQSAEL